MKSKQYSFLLLDDDFTTKPSSKKEASKPDLKPVDPNDFFANAKPRPKKETGK